MFTRALAADGSENYYRLHHDMGVIAYRTGDRERAERELKIAESINPWATKGLAALRQLLATPRNKVYGHRNIGHTLPPEGSVKKKKKKKMKAVTSRREQTKTRTSSSMEASQAIPAIRVVVNGEAWTEEVEHEEKTGGGWMKSGKSTPPIHMKKRAINRYAPNPR